MVCWSVDCVVCVWFIGDFIVMYVLMISMVCVVLL